MPRCPKCQRFQEEDGLCPDCRVEALETVSALNHDTLASVEEEQDTLLLTVSDENEANIVQSLLKLNNIPSLRKHRGVGGYLQIYMGTSNLGIDIFVLKKHLKEAEAILETYDDDYPENVGTENEGTQTEDAETERNGLGPNDDNSDDLDTEDPISKRKNGLIVILTIFFALNLIIIILLSTRRG